MIVNGGDHIMHHFNLLKSVDAYMRQKTGPSMVQVII